MRVVVMLAVAALIALVVALFTGSTWPAILVVALAVVGIVLLLRDWRAGRAVGEFSSGAAPAAVTDGGVPLRPDEFSPDISTDPEGPSSNARSDHPRSD